MNCHYSGAGGQIGAGSSLGAYIRKIAALEKAKIRESCAQVCKGGLQQVRCHPPLSMSMGDGFIPKASFPAVGTIAWPRSPGVNSSSMSTFGSTVEVASFPDCKGRTQEERGREGGVEMVGRASPPQGGQVAYTGAQGVWILYCTVALTHCFWCSSMRKWLTNKASKPQTSKYDKASMPASLSCTLTHIRWSKPRLGHLVSPSVCWSCMQGICILALRVREVGTL